MQIKDHRYVAHGDRQCIGGLLLGMLTAAFDQQGFDPVTKIKEKWRMLFLKKLPDIHIGVTFFMVKVIKGQPVLIGRGQNLDSLIFLFQGKREKQPLFTNITILWRCFLSILLIHITANGFMNGPVFFGKKKIITIIRVKII